MTQKSKSLLFPMLLVIYEIATYLSNDMYLPAVPEMMRDLKLSTAQVQLTLTLWFMGLASMPLVIGVISDRFGRRAVLLLGGVFYILSTMLCALTYNYSILLAARFIEGSMVATMMVAGYACIHELYEHKDAVRILALMGSISILAPALGPLLGSVVLYVTTWRGIFWLIVIWSIISILTLTKWMPETHPSEKREKINIKQLFTHYWQVLTNKKFMLQMMILGFIFTGFIVWITSGPLLIIESFQQSAIRFGLIQAGIFSAYILGSHGVNHLVEKIEINRLINIGLIITLMGGIFLFAFSYIFPQNLTLFLIAMAVYSFGAALCFAPLNRMIIEASDAPMGVRVALFTVFFTAYGALGSALASLFFDGTTFSIGILIAISILFSCFLKRVNKN